MKLKLQYFFYILIVSFFLNNRSYAHDFKLTSNKQSPKLNQLIQELDSEIPDEMKTVINQSVEIKFKNLNPNSIESIDQNCSDHIILAREKFQFSNRDIEIENVFFKEIQRGDKRLDCPHKSLFVYFKATVVHELAHLYDEKKKISSQPLFLNISGWIAKGLLIKKRTNLNQEKERSPNPYEYKNKNETFAVNFEHFLYDSNYRCHRPTYAEYYSKLFHFSPEFKDDCLSNQNVVITPESASSKNNIKLIQSFDLERLYQVHYFLAGKGEETMSRFGHSMFRLVFCAPGKVKGPSCMNDVSYHFIVSFRANVQDLVLDYIKGLNGEYPSTLFLIPLTDVIDEYTKGEFREIKSVPINLNKIQLNRFLNRVKELFWSYKGRYYFFTNNCANESMNLLRVALSESNEIQTQNILTPGDIYNYLIKTQLSDPNLFIDLKLAQKNGYYFPSTALKVGSSLKYLGSKEVKLENFLKNKNASERFLFYKSAIMKSSNILQTASNALRVEDIVYTSLNIQLSKKIMNALTDQNNDSLKETGLNEKYSEFQKNYNALSFTNFLQSGYGIPLVDEFKEIPLDLERDTKENIEKISADIHDIGKNLFPNELNEIIESTQTVIFLKKVIQDPNFAFE